MRDYTISYNLNGGTITVDNPTTYKSRDENIVLNNPSKEGYTFKGWSGTDLVGDENLAVTIQKGSVGDREYTANYIPNTYYIKFNGNGGTGSIDNQQMTYDFPSKLTQNVFTKEGFEFAGWNTLSDGTGMSYLDEEEVLNLTSLNNEKITLYAQWVKNVKYAVQIYGINQDVDENDNVIGLTFGPASGESYNNSYVIHEYVANEEETYDIRIVTIAVDENGDETRQKEEFLKVNEVNVTRTSDQVAQRQNINLHEMTWEEISSIKDKTLFEDCMLCGDTKSIEITLNRTIMSGNTYDQYGDGTSSLYVSTIAVNIWNPSQSQNSYVGDEESGIVLTDEEKENGSNAKNAGGYSSSRIRASLIGENNKTNRVYAGDNNLTTNNCLYSCLPAELKEVIVAKKIKYITGTDNTTGNYFLNQDIADTIWLFSPREISGTGTYSGESLEGDAYQKFSAIESKYYISSYTDKVSNSRALFDESGANNCWITRSPALNTVEMVCRVGYTGYINYAVAKGINACAFGFCIK